jgi:ABC-type metal ion transport system substrate-binding protein
MTPFGNTVAKTAKDKYGYYSQIHALSRTTHSQTQHLKNGDVDLNAFPTLRFLKSME